jgi:hypothetical protein
MAISELKARIAQACTCKWNEGHDRRCPATPDFLQLLDLRDAELNAGASFTCPDCGRTSYNPNDARHRYCGACHKFFDGTAARQNLEPRS